MTMKYFHIDEDTINTLLDLLTEASEHSENIGDKDSTLLYQYLIGELEEAKISKNLPNPSTEEIARMKKVERYLRMLQKGLKNPNNEKENERRRKFARDMLKDDEQEVVEVTKIEPYFSKNMSMKSIEQILKSMTNLTDYEKYKIYCSERDKRHTEEGRSLDKMCKDLGINRYDDSNK